MHPMTASLLFRRQLVRSRASQLVSRAFEAPAPRSRIFNTSHLRPQARRSYSNNSSGTPPPRPPNQPAPVRFFPFLVLIGFGSAFYILLVKQRVIANENAKTGTMPALPPPQTLGQLPAPHKDKPAFSADAVTVIFVLGGPGAGKGTQCAKLVSDYGFTHLSAGDLLRAEQDRSGSQFGELIKDCIRNGAIVPQEVTVQLLENAMTEKIGSGEENKSKHGKFLIDGFPRKMDQALMFEEAVCPAKFVLFYDCPEEEMQKRLLERGKTSGRADDNEESMRKRFRTFVETSMPVVDHYEKEGRVIKVDATPSSEAVYKDTQKKLTDRLGKDF